MRSPTDSVDRRPLLGPMRRFRSRHLRSVSVQATRSGRGAQVRDLHRDAIAGAAGDGPPIHRSGLTSIVAAGEPVGNASARSGAPNTWTDPQDRGRPVTSPGDGIERPDVASMVHAHQQARILDAQ
jgi:hypothetical protein